VAQLRNPVLATGTGTQSYDPDGQPTGGAGYLDVTWVITDIASPLPLEMIRIDVTCAPGAGRTDQYLFIGNANFTTFRTANVG
jgi:hypothetical protein